MNTKEKFHLLKSKCKAFWDTHEEQRKTIVGIIVTAALLMVFLISKSIERTTHVFHSENGISFEGAHILGGKDDLYKRQEHLLSQEIKSIREDHEKLVDTVRNLSEKVAQILDRMAQLQAALAASHPSALSAMSAGITPPSPPGNINPASSDLEANRVGDAASIKVGDGARSPANYLERGLGPDIINFPVKPVAPKEMGIVVPTGSYVKAKMMTGIEAPEGKSYPVLLQLDFAYIGPNESKIDLSGCFGISKAQGDLSTERVQMQLTKISCVSKQGRMFEKDVNGFIADNKDNSFAVIGEVNSKQDRVAAQAFLSSVVEGVGKALQQSQTTAQTTPLGGSQSVVTGDSAKYIAAGGASQAASQVTQWYLKQAESLLPTINVGSGRDIWIVMQDKVELPQWYFKKAIEKSVFGYVTALTE